MKLELEKVSKDDMDSFLILSSLMGMGMMMFFAPMFGWLAIFIFLWFWAVSLGQIIAVYFVNRYRKRKYIKETLKASHE